MPLTETTSEETVMRTVLPPADCGTANWLATCEPVPGRGATEPVILGTFGKPYVTERLWWMGGEYAVTQVQPYVP